VHQLFRPVSRFRYRLLEGTAPYFDGARKAVQGYWDEAAGAKK
jgi:hypothetical protein